MLNIPQKYGVFDVLFARWISFEAFAYNVYKYIYIFYIYIFFATQSTHCPENTHAWNWNIINIISTIPCTIFCCPSLNYIL